MVPSERGCHESTARTPRPRVPLRVGGRDRRRSSDGRTFPAPRVLRSRILLRCGEERPPVRLTDSPPLGAEERPPPRLIDSARGGTRSRLPPYRRPLRSRVVAGEHDAVVQPRRAALPELDLACLHPIPAPVRRPRHGLVVGEPGADLGHLLLEGGSGCHGFRLVARPRRQLRTARARGEVRVVALRRQGRGRAEHDDLALQRVPGEEDRHRRVRRERVALPRQPVGEEPQRSVVVDSAEQHRSRGRSGFGIHRRHDHRVRLRQVGRVVEPAPQKNERGCRERAVVELVERVIEPVGEGVLGHRGPPVGRGRHHRMAVRPPPVPACGRSRHRPPARRNRGRQRGSSRCRWPGVPSSP